MQAPSRLGHEGFCDPPLNTTESRSRENTSFIDLCWLVEGKQRVVTLLFQVQPCSSLRACWVVICRFYEYIRHRKQAHQRRLRTRLLLQGSAPQAAPLGRLRQSGKQSRMAFTHLSYLHLLENMGVFGPLGHDRHASFFLQPPTVAAPCIKRHLERNSGPHCCA